VEVRGDTDLGDALPLDWTGGGALRGGWLISEAACAFVEEGGCSDRTLVGGFREGGRC
jgi:hypothetical protein